MDDSQGCGRKALELRDSVTFNSAHTAQRPRWPGAAPLTSGHQRNLLHPWAGSHHHMSPQPNTALHLQPPELCNALPWRHHAPLTAGGGKRNLYNGRRKGWVSDLQLLEEMGQAQSGKPGTKSAAEAQHLAIFPIRNCRAHFAVARAQGACCCCCFYK